MSPRTPLTIWDRSYTLKSRNSSINFDQKWNQLIRMAFLENSIGHFRLLRVWISGFQGGNSKFQRWRRAWIWYGQAQKDPQEKLPRLLSTINASIWSGMFRCIWRFVIPLEAIYPIAGVMQIWAPGSPQTIFNFKLCIFALNRCLEIDASFSAASHHRR